MSRPQRAKPYRERLVIALNKYSDGKICFKCGESKSVLDYRFLNGKKCKDCLKVESSERKRRAYHKNPTKRRKYMREYVKAYRSKNKEKCKEKDKQRYLRRKKNPEYSKYKKEYAQSERGRATNERGFNKFVENHPMYNQKYLEGIARKAWIHCPMLNFDVHCRLSLDAPFNKDSENNLYKMISSERQIA